ncbi:MAG: oxidoreductase [Planctomycetota bacterium]|nr:MAG: oxidoreductase [Planctomycetota bacterium]
MTQNIPQEILDSLTKVKMPDKVKSKEVDHVIEISGMDIPIFFTEALVLGSGAAGLRAAVELKRANIDVLVASTGLFSGTSACSGSDKQTLHTAGTSNKGDDFCQLAKDIGGGGCMDQDTAYIEAVGSIKAFAGLQYLGLPLPEDRFGSVLRYQTDHDDVGRATSCGPRTSRLMVKVLCEEAVRLNIPFLKRCEGIQILTKEISGKISACGMLAINKDLDHNKYNLCVILFDSLVLATGGPGELYRDSVYPKFCFGSLGMAIESGIEVCNITESQFGIGTRRTEFPWNLSGTYVQVLPYIYSLDKDGDEHNFLADYFRTTKELVSNVFRKGYQWPFHATRMLDFQSSLVDLAIFVESQKGHTVLMDFNRNPKPIEGLDEFSLNNLDEDVRDYLKNNGALQDLPIDRLTKMNPLAIELYKMHGHDLNEKPLPFNVSNQHMNGGISVDLWNRSSLNNCYAVGEICGTHGVTRPGGSALNAGQVGGMRVAQHIKSKSISKPEEADLKSFEDQIDNSLKLISANLDNKSALKWKDISKEIQDRMSDKAGFICQLDEIEPALIKAKKLSDDIDQKGIVISKDNKVVDYFRWKQTALTSEAILTALNYFVKNGGGSRGARAICSNKGSKIPLSKNGPIKEFSFIEEQEKDKDKKIVLKFKNNEFEITEVPIRSMESPDIIYFEKNWSSFLNNDIFKDNFKHS